MKPEPGMLLHTGVRLTRPLGSGGMATVWLAEHLGLEAPVVVKMMHPALAADDEAVERFMCEAMAAARLRSPHIVQILDQSTTDEGIPYIVMEYLEGRDLGALLEARGGALPPRDVYAIVSQLAKALSRAHAAGIVHRDIKPANIFLAGGPDDTPFVKLLDFGVAKIDRPGLSTRTGSIMGTPVYMAPEQIVSGRRVDARSDVWSVGVVVFQMLTGRKPFEADDFGELVLRLHGNEKPPRITDVDPTLPVALDVWFARACAKKPDDRFATIDELVVSLRSALSSRPARTASQEPGRTIRRALLGAGGVAVLGLVVAIASGKSREDGTRLASLASLQAPAPTTVTTITQATEPIAPAVAATTPQAPAAPNAEIVSPRAVAPRAVAPRPTTTTTPATNETPSSPGDDGLLYRR